MTECVLSALWGARELLLCAARDVQKLEKDIRSGPAPADIIAALDAVARALRELGVEPR